MSAQQQVVMLLRHAEKPLSSTPFRGVSIYGRHDGHSLTVEGWVRAGALAELLAPSGGEPRADLYRPDVIYGAEYEGGHSKRSAETVAPLAARLGLRVDSSFPEGKEKKLAHHLRQQTGVSLVCWHHNGMSKIVRHLGPVAPDPPPDWPDDRYDLIWTCRRRGDEPWSFTQVPQLLLPGDRDDPIAA